MTEQGYHWERQLLQRSGFMEMLARIAAQKNLILFAVVMIVLSYGYDLFNFSLHIDSEWTGASSGVKGAWLEQGRWGMYTLSYQLFSDPIMPFVPPLLAIGGLAIGGLLWFAAMSQPRSLATYLALALMISCPVYYFTAYFTALGYGVGVACALVGWATYLLFKRSLWALPMVVVCYTWAVGIYQAMLPVMAVAFAVCLLDHFFNRRGDIKFFIGKSVAFTLCAVIAVVASHAITLTQIDGAAKEFSYIASYSKLQWTTAYLQQALQASIATLLQYYLGVPQYYLYWVTEVAKIMSLAVVVVMLLCLVLPRGVLAKVLALGMLAAIILAPAGMLILGGGDMPPRTQVAIVWVFAGLVYLAVSVRSIAVRAIFLLLTILCAFHFVGVTNRFSFYSVMQWEADKHRSLLIINQVQKHVAKLPEKQPHEGYRLEIVGMPEREETPLLGVRDSVGASLYKWNGGEPMRIVALFRAMGIFDYWPATVEQRRALVPITKTMPVWPDPDSVQVQQDVIVIKFSDYTAKQMATVCDANPLCEQ